MEITMKQSLTLLLGIALILGFSPAFAGQEIAPTIQGKYVEVRSCDVYVGYCFANAEMGLTGEEAIMTWDVTQGSWNDVDLTGKKVIAIVRANATLGDRDHNPLPAKSILVIDSTATDAQADALSAMAKEFAGALLDNVVKTERTDITVQMDKCTDESCATVRAGDIVNIIAQCLNKGDKVCGNEEAYYAPLTDVKNAMPHYTDRDMFAGKGLGVTWDSSGRRSAYLATFAR